MDPSEELLYQAAVPIADEEQSEQDIITILPDWPSDESLHEAAAHFLMKDETTKWLLMKCLIHYFNIYDKDVMWVPPEEKLFFINFNILFVFQPWETCLIS